MLQKQEKLFIQDLIDSIPGRRRPLSCAGLNGSEKAYLVSRLFDALKQPMCLIVPTLIQADQMAEEIAFFTQHSQAKIHLFPSYNIKPSKYLDYHNETAAHRIKVLYRLMEGGLPRLTIATVEGVLQKLIPKKELSAYAELVMKGEELDRDYLIEKLISGGYTRCAIVEEPGDFSVRGDILDIFSPLYADPVRIELFGDTVDSIRFFSPETQRKINDVEEAVILPAREVIVSRGSLDDMVERIKKRAVEFDMPSKEVRKLLHCIKKEGVYKGLERFLSLIFPCLDTFFDYLPQNTLFVLSEPKALESAADQIWNQISKNFLADPIEEGMRVPLQSLYLKWPQANDLFIQQKALSITALSVSRGGQEAQPFSAGYEFRVYDNLELSAQMRHIGKNEKLFAPLADWMREQGQARRQVIMVCSNKSQADRLKFLLAPYAIDPVPMDWFPKITGRPQPPGLCFGRLLNGFVWPNESLAVVTENDIFGGKRRLRKSVKPKVQADLITLTDLKKDDLVVHREHGIGRYAGLVKLELDGIANDFLLISYLDNDKLYLPVDRMRMISKYMGVDGVLPVLDKMGGNSWGRKKDKVKRSVAKMAKELLSLYASRKVQKGYAFQMADSYFQDFEAGFAYEETADQLKAIEDVLTDMESPQPMDRLVCGDVGYGKTEVALRASFKAVLSNKQVAILVPTTILAEQHYKTFTHRFKAYPVEIASLSRFRSKKEQGEILKNLGSGKTDIIIGTHRLIQKDVVFKDLGLVILDEEQRFGVRHKEKLKKLRTLVDVLALTATPIPRTLHMSLVGVRDISIISTPPEHRQAIITYISEFEDGVVTEAIQKELNRGGQIFFIHNAIHNIWSMAKYLQQLVPEVRLDVAHSQLTERELEDVMLRFIKKEIDMLVCTTIVESGLDIPSANTMLINRADRFGLAQMYQLRGRVGRSEEQAYAYLFIPSETVLSKDAQKRLKVLMEHSDLGSGFQIAMSDLKIRGGGSILGASQSGHIAAVGYDMFLKLMENAVSELKGEPIREDLEPEINIPMSCLIPEAYMPDIDQRLTAYRKLSKLTELSEIGDFKNELMDRYGGLPPEVVNLLLKIMLKALAIKAGVRRLDLIGENLSLYFSPVHQKKPFAIMDMITRPQSRFKFTPDNVFKAKLDPAGTPNGLLLQTKNILKEITGRVNG
jgi:transcription-repair coupling factor (superfamily II helicase)